MRKSLLKRISAVVCAVAMTVAMTSTCFAADRWTQWFGQNENWYEGALGELTAQTDSSWTAAIEQIGWGGVWGAQVKDENITLKKGVEYEISFDLVSDTVDKWVCLKVADKEDNHKLLFGDWIQLKKGQKYSYSKKFTLDSEATEVVFGIGGDFGDRTDEKEIYDLLSELPDDKDAMYSTTITCTNFSLTEVGAETGDSDTKTESGDSKEKTTTNTSGKSSSTTVKTGDFTPITCAAVAIVAASVIVVFTRRREEA